jgi:hypothetical protein
MSEDQDIPPWEPDRAYFKAILKGGKGYEAPWVNIGAGTAGEFRRALVAFFGWDAEESEAMSPAQLTFNAVQEWAAMNNVGDAFPDARVIPTGRGRSNAAEAYAAAKEEQPPPDPKAVLLGKIEEQATVPDLKRLYAENKDAFDGDPSLLAAYKAKGKSLSK